MQGVFEEQRLVYFDWGKGCKFGETETGHKRGLGTDYGESCV